MLGLEITPGIELLCSIIIRENVNLFNRLDPMWFDDYPHEKKLYDFIKFYYGRNPQGRLPTYTVCEYYSTKYNLVLIRPINDPLDYNKIVYDRYMLNAMNKAGKAYAELNKKMQNTIRDGLHVDSIEEIKKELTKFYRDQLTKLESGSSESLISTYEENYHNFVKRQTDNRFRSHELGAMTPYEPINKATNGIKAGEWFLYTGNMKMGKSYIWLNTVADMWIKQGLSTLITSMEMDALDDYGSSGTFARLMSIISGINPSLVRTGLLPDASLKLIDKKIKHYKDMSVYETGKLPPLYFFDGEKSKELSAIRQQINILQPQVVAIDSVYKAIPPDAKYMRDQWERERRVCEYRREMVRTTKTIGIDTHQFGKSAIRLDSDDVLADNVGGVVNWTQDPNYVIGLLPEGDKNDKRRFIHIAGRDGGRFDSFVTRFEFDPLDFSVIEGYNADDGGIDDSGNYEL